MLRTGQPKRLSSAPYPAYGDLETTNFYLLFMSIYNVVVGFAAVEANAHKDALKATVAALQAIPEQSELVLYEDA